jgi:hypothetical protein
VCVGPATLAKIGLHPFSAQREKTLPAYFAHLTKVLPKDMPQEYAEMLQTLPFRTDATWEGGTFKLETRSPLTEEQWIALQALSATVEADGEGVLAGLNQLQKMKHSDSVKKASRSLALGEGLTGVAYAMGTKGAEVNAEYVVTKDTDGKTTLAATTVRFCLSPPWSCRATPLALNVDR